MEDASRVKGKEFATVAEAFQETIQLPCPVAADKAKAIFKDGQLVVEMPKANGNLAQSSTKNNYQ
jgi:HSP20 family molecular chaperone IbpA